jgi:hypothetical protein
MSGVSADEARARSEGKRIAHVIVISIAVAFIGASAVQIIPAVFGLDARPLPSAPSVPSVPTEAEVPGGSSERRCAGGIQALALGLDHATLGAWRDGVLPEWNTAADVERACAESPQGLDAWAALLRLRRAEEDVVLRGLAELAPLRRDVAARLPADLR